MTIPALPFPPQPSRDIEHINLLAVFTYVWGGFIAFFACFGLIYVFMGIMVLTQGKTIFPATAPAGGPNIRPEQFVGWMMIGAGGFLTLIGWTTGALNLYSARSMQKQKRRTFSLVIAGLNCLSVPFGTVLGVFTFIVLSRETVVQMYRTTPHQNAR